MLQLTNLSLLEPVKWVIFRTLEKLGDLRGNKLQAAANTFPVHQDALWVFVSTIGELNAINPFLRTLLERLKPLKLVLITDHEHYRAPYLVQYPDATVFVTMGHSSDARQLASHLPPAMLLVAEIPCQPSDAPCRFSYAFMRTAKQHHAIVCLINGWLYHYTPPCRMDAIEKRLFMRDYIRMFDVACVQTDDVCQSLIRAGASTDRVVVTGNIKFDALQRTDWSPDQARSPVFLNTLIASNRPIIVAGCVTDHKEQHLVLDAFVRLHDKYPQAFLVLAPRHPEVQEHMVALESFLAVRGLRGQFRSRIQDVPPGQEIQCLVLDTIGELKDFYAASTIAYVGRNHNILEPLAFGKPVILSPGWEPTYPSYPVYQAMLEAKGVLQIDDTMSLGDTWLALLDTPGKSDMLERDLKNALDNATGASARCTEAIMPYVMRASKKFEI
jgi:3-deoxy-D-manno-octulosonic-acid transferase